MSASGLFEVTALEEDPTELISFPSSRGSSLKVSSSTWEAIQAEHRRLHAIIGIGTADQYPVHVAVEFPSDARYNRRPGPLKWPTIICRAEPEHLQRHQDAGPSKAEEVRSTSIATRRQAK